MNLRELMIERVLFACDETELIRDYGVTDYELEELSDIDLFEVYKDAMSINDYTEVYMYTVEWNEKFSVWEIIRWGASVDGVRAGESVEQFSMREKKEAYQLRDLYNMEIEQEIYSEFG